MRSLLVLVVLLASGCSSIPKCGEARTYSKINEDGSFSVIGKETLVQLPADQRELLISQITEVKATDTGCWFELEDGSSLRLHDPKNGRDVEFGKTDGAWHFTRVLYPIEM